MNPHALTRLQDKEIYYCVGSWLKLVAKAAQKRIVGLKLGQRSPLQRGDRL